MIDPRPEAVLIRTETGPGQNDQVDLAFVKASLVPEKQLKPAVDSAIADYVKRNSSVMKLQRDFNLPTYDLMNELEERALLAEQDPSKEDSACRAFHRKYPGYDRWVELSAVGFNEDQTVAVVYLAEWRASDASCQSGIFGHGGYQMLQKEGSNWHLINNQVFSEWIS